MNSDPMKVGIILGSNSDIPPQLDLSEVILETDFGPVPLWESRGAGPNTLAIILRHGAGHALLPHLVNHRANIRALQQWGVECIVSFSVVGVLDPKLPLATPLIFEDVFFPSNQLPDGSTCTLFTQPNDPNRGHLLVSQACSPRLRQHLIQLLPDPLAYGIYGHVFGPRFSTQIELVYLTQLGISAISQTSGPEFVLAGEAGLPYALVGFGVDYASPDPSTRSSVGELNANLKQWAQTLPLILTRLYEYAWPQALEFDQGYFYRIAADLPSRQSSP
ncbi:MAG: MTAP family purine nucleoside phosphorylase [Synechococcaceae cyanobacterium SM2_3_1]|nr:MTAP family purine nucleoside phosphorylase [Synechococcaceae cyanobacterium SM2_3_1]